MPPKNNIERRSRRKKQTRLTFDPVPGASSSPSGSVSAPVSKYSPAKVRYHLPGNGTPSIKKNAQKLLPTPAKSSQVPVEAPTDSDDDSDIIPQSSRRVRNSSPPMTKPFNFDASEDDTVPVISNPIRKRGKMDGYSRISDSSDGSLPEEPIGSAKKKHKTPIKRAITIESDEESEPDLPKLKTPRSFIKGGSSYNAPIGSSKTSRRKQKSSSTTKSSSARNRRQKSVTLSDSEDELNSSVRVTRSRGHASKPLEDAANEILLEEQDDEDEDDIITTSPAKRRQKAIVIEDDEDEDDDQESDESEVIVSPLKRRRQASTEGEDSPSGGASPTKRRRANKIEVPSRKTRQHKTKKRTAKQKTMELMKRKRAGEKIDELTTSESEAEGDGALYDTESDLQVLSEFEDEPEYEAPTKAKKKGKSKRKSTTENVEDDEDDWIVDDEEDMLGVPLGLHDIPLEFTHNSHKPLKEHFKDAVEWMIHNKINPAFPRDDPIYHAAFRKLDDEVRGYATSKYVSSVWQDGFNKALWARPFFVERELDIAGLDMKCNACNRSNHPPKFVIQLQGKAYSKKTLEEIDPDSESEDDSDSEKSSKGKSIDENGNILPGEDEEFFLGRFCASNARIAHSLIHWKHALNEWVLGNLEGQGYLTPTKLAERDKMKAKKRTKLAYAIVDNWEADNTIKSLYGDFKRSLDAAREGKQERWGK